ncbi:hypothetical protein J9317_08180 [Metabacillus sp. KIGAM252]|uniref:Histidine phosphatase family protein n=1 Tax=Metabacillus flavus TaxID=2823519 RepID=A0ABS5LDD4_9BACI|nr:hypothetical protein [Metabacillus flavus]MBS2968732.1 hypothetical protein [Metabacillus flavus]
MHPSKIVLLRHAEEPNEPNHHNLSPEGWIRAKLLCPLLIFLYQHIAGVYAAGIGPDDQSKRKIQTIIPLIKYQLNEGNGGTAINTVRLSFETKPTANKILTNGLYHKKVVIVCWSHKKLPELARELNAKLVPEKWPEDRYDVLWEIDGHTGKLKQIPQLLMPGDSLHGIGE